MVNRIDNRDARLSLLYASDVHGHVLPVRYMDNSPADNGLLKLGTIVRRVREDEESGTVLYLDNGDLLQGTPFAYYHACVDAISPHPIVAVMNRLRLDAFVPGNHEFNYGPEFVDRARRESGFPWLCANILKEGTDEPYFGTPYRLIDLPCGARIALLGLTTPYIPNWEQPAHIAGLSFESAVAAARGWVPYLREKEGAHVVVASYHGGFERDPFTGEEAEEQTGENEGWRLCAETEGLDVLLTGHQHRQIAGAHIEGTLVVQPGHRAETLARVVLQLRPDGKGGWRIGESRTDLLEAREAEADPELLELVRVREARTQEWLDRPLCRVEGDMTIADHMAARLEEHPLVELINRIQMSVSGAAISCTSLFDDVSPGFGPRVSMREVTANYPYPNTLRVLRLTGADIREALEWTAAYFALSEDGRIVVDPAFLSPKPQHYNYDMWEGVEYGINVSRPVGSRIEGLTVGGSELKPEDRFDVVMNHYRASGGGNYRMFRGKPCVKEVTVDMTEIIAEYLTKAEIVRARADGNWRVYS